MGFVNVPTSLSSHSDSPVVKTGTKRSNSNLDNDKRTSKRKKTSKSDNANRKIRKSLQTQRKFNCCECFSDWADSIRREFSGDPTKIGAPNPKQKIPTFTSFEDYRFHCLFAHDERMAKYIKKPCKETSCFLVEDHGFWPHGDIKCNICSRGFKLKKDHDGHISSEHVDIESMNSNEIFELYQSEIY